MFSVITFLTMGCGNSAKNKLEQCLKITNNLIEGTHRSGGAYGEAKFLFDKNNCKSVYVTYTALSYYGNEDAKINNMELQEGGPDNTYKIVGDYVVDGGSGQGARFLFLNFEDEKPNTILIQVSGANNSWAHYANITLSKENFLRIKKILSIKGDFPSTPNASSDNIEVKEKSIESVSKKSNDFTKNNKTKRELLQGKWQSMDDSSNYLIFDSKLRKELGNGMNNWEIETYVLSDRCLNNSDLEAISEVESESYIYCVKSDMCWYIVNLDSENLVLSYVGRGNTLKYKRV
jgi:hypothetical protein